MRDVLRRLTLERALQVAIVVFIVTTVLAAGALLSWLDAARTARWIAFAAFAGLALALPWRPPPRRLRPVFVAAGAFVALTLVSAAWSSEPRATLARALALGVLFAAAGALAAAGARRPETVRRLLHGVLLGAVAVAVGGLLVLAFRHDRAVVPATTSSAARYQGLGGGPDTAAMVLSVAVPLAVWALAEARAWGGRALAAGALALLLGSIVASDSRGALAGASAGAFAYVVLAARGRRRVAGVAAVIVVLAACVVIARAPSPAETAAPERRAEPQRPQPAAGYVDANQLLRLEDDVGHPPLGTADTSRKPRTLFGTSGRAEAWAGALSQVEERPLVGFGFGREEGAFVDRYVGFHSDTVENSYLGLLLQLGAIGLLSFAALVGAILGVVARGLSRLDGRERGLAAACAGGLAVGLVLACFQSYIYAVGNNATAAVWICAFLLAAAAATKRGEPQAA